MSSQSPPHEYRIRRIAKACTNCRRKKAKCSGEQPVCKNCHRLSQACHYQDTSAVTRLKDGQDASERESEDLDEPLGRRYEEQFSQRIAAVEGKLDQLLDTINSFIPLLQKHSSSAAVPPTNTDLFTVSPCYDGSHYQVAQSEKQFLKELPPMDLIMSLVDLFFSRVHNQPYSFFHEQNFRQRLASGFIPNYLLFAILASSIRFSTDDYFQSKQQTVIMAYASNSWNHIVRVCFASESDPDLQICQAITLLSIIDFTAGRRHPGWMKIGLSIRLAQELRLMLEPDPELSYSDQEERRRVFWSIYVLDKLCSCGRARPAALLDAQCHVQLPGHEIDFRSGQWRRTSTLKQALSSVGGHGERPSNAALVVLVASIVGKCAQHMIHESNRTEGGLPPWDSKSDFAIIHSTLLQLETDFEIGSSIEEALAAQNCSSLGAYDMQTAGPIIFSYALFYTTQCLLNHPFLLYQQSKSRGTKPPASFLNRALQSGRENAYLMSKLLMDAEALGCSILYSFIGYCTTVCAGFHTMYINDQNVDYRQQARQCLANERAFLGKYSLVWKNGKNMLRIIEKLASQPSPILAVVASTPQFELLDAEEMSDLWAAIDYTTMSQDPSLTNSRAETGVSPNWNGSLDTNLSANPLVTSVSDRTMSSSTGIVHQEKLMSYNSMMVPGTSPFSAFFTDTAMNFGA